MKWKIYFGALSIYALFSLAQIVSVTSDQRVFLLGHLAIFMVELVGLYSFLFHKAIFPRTFWRNFLVINILLDTFAVVYTLYPQAWWMQFYAPLNGPDVMDAPAMMIALLIDIPLLFAMYKLSRDEYYKEPSKTMAFVTPGVPKWSLLQTAFWGYSLVMTSVFFLSSLLPHPASVGARSEGTDFWFGAILMVPMLLFWLSIIVQIPHYHKTWWRLTLLANGLLFSLLLLFGMLFPSDGVIPESTTVSDFISLLQFSLVIISLYVYGHEQFVPRKAKKEIVS